MTSEQLQELDLSWDMENGFLGKLRSGVFDDDLYKYFLILLRSISFEENELIPRNVVSLLWYIPLFMEWQAERVENIDKEYYKNAKTRIENELEKILGVP